MKKSYTEIWSVILWNLKETSLILCLMKHVTIMTFCRPIQISLFSCLNLLVWLIRDWCYRICWRHDFKLIFLMNSRTTGCHIVQYFDPWQELMTEKICREPFGEAIAIRLSIALLESNNTTKVFDTNITITNSNNTINHFWSILRLFHLSLLVVRQIIR